MKINKFRAALCSGIALTSLAGVAHAQTRTFDIPAESAGQAISDFARQADVQIVAPGETLRGRATPALQGEFDVSDALKRLLRGTGLGFTSNSDRTVWYVSAVDGAATRLAVAQLSAPPPPEGGPPAAAQSPMRASGDAGSPVLSEVIVTAQRRGENLQQVPISVTALSADQLKAMGGTSSQDLTLIPSVVFNGGVGGGQITIRGIGGTNSGVDPGNAVYVDGVYQFAPQSSLFEINAIDRIEILKGPQGTLFGRNSVGGLVHVITRDPTTDKASGEMTVGYANYDTVSGNVYVNAPITDALAVNVAAYGFDQRSGWGTNFGTGKAAHVGYAYGIRVKLKWEAPDGKTDATLAVSYNKDRPVATGIGAIAPGTFNVLGQPSFGIYNSNVDVDSYRQEAQYTEALTIHHDLGFARLTSITAFDTVKDARAVVDGDGSPAPILPVTLIENFYTVSQELHLQSKEGSRLQWIIGGIYFDNKNPGSFSIGPIQLTPRQTTHSYAIFGQGTYAVTDDTKLTGGLRYTEDKIDVLNGLQENASKLTWRLAADHKFTENMLGYASYSRGYKSGLVNLTAPIPVAASPETLDAYEVGLKTETFEHRLRVNAAIFYYNFKSVQIQLFDPGTATAYITNAGDARSYGLDLDVAAEPIEGLILTAGASYTDATFTTNPAGASLLCFTPTATGATSAPCELKGRRLAFAPKFAPTVGVTYKRPTDIGAFVFSGTYSYNSGYYNDPSNYEPAHTKSYKMLNASLTWTSPSEQLTASIWGKNLLDEKVFSGADVGALVGLATNVYPMAPRTFGGTVGVKF